MPPGRFRIGKAGLRRHGPATLPSDPEGSLPRCAKRDWTKEPVWHVLKGNGMPTKPELERLYDEHAQALFAFLLNLTRDVEDTRDVLQELFIKLARQPALLRAARNERAFLLRMAHNAALDLIRRRASRERMAAAVAAEADAGSPSLPAGDPDAQAFRTALAAALAELPPRAARGGPPQTLGGPDLRANRRGSRDAPEHGCQPLSPRPGQTAQSAASLLRRTIMSTNDPFEQRLLRQPLRSVPPAWREAILSQASRAAGADSPAVGWRHLLRWGDGVLRELRWPSPRAWAGLAAVWGMIAVLNLVASGGAEPASRPAPGAARQFWQMLKEQRQVLAELDGVSPVSEPGPVRVPPARPQTWGGTIILNT